MWSIAGCLTAEFSRVENVKARLSCARGRGKIIVSRTVLDSGSVHSFCFLLCLKVRHNGNFIFTVNRNATETDFWQLNVVLQWEGVESSTKIIPATKFITSKLRKGISVPKTSQKPLQARNGWTKPDGWKRKWNASAHRQVCKSIIESQALALFPPSRFIARSIGGLLTPSSSSSSRHLCLYVRNAINFLFAASKRFGTSDTVARMHL